ncbi:calmodulin-A-like [Actinia tenebrosa]|uniref:Calmodulin-A-like n=1 Tax=Actinia tenebrosa TaxID=6105 RepID=A0A6P8I7T9_ACTTE|nr:calmodulin-A-like [Actinia tenebrosa]
MEHFSADEIDEFKECFSLNDQDSDGFIGREELETIMRSLGEPVTYIEINEMVKRFGKNRIKFPDFLKLMAEQRAKKSKPAEEILSAFAACDKRNTKSISRAELKHFMVDTGEKMSQQEFEKMMRDCGMDRTQTIRYQDFVQALTQVK